jgi:hypothetical protein
MDLDCLKKYFNKILLSWSREIKEFRWSEKNGKKLWAKQNKPVVALPH